MVEGKRVTIDERMQTTAGNLEDVEMKADQAVAGLGADANTKMTIKAELETLIGEIQNVTDQISKNPHGG